MQFVVINVKETQTIVLLQMKPSHVFIHTWYVYMFDYLKKHEFSMA